MDIKKTDLGSAVRSILNAVTQDIIGCDRHEDSCDKNPWQDHGYVVEDGPLRIDYVESCDGYNMNLVFFEEKLVYKNTSYDDSKPEIKYYVPGKWEQLLIEWNEIYEMLRA